MLSSSQYLGVSNFDSYSPAHHNITVGAWLEEEDAIYYLKCD